MFDTLQTSLYHGLTADTAEDAIVTAVNMREDTDTVGAVTGAIAGARSGADVLPDRWTGELVCADEITRLESVLLTPDFTLMRILLDNFPRARFRHNLSLKTNTKIKTSWLLTAYSIEFGCCFDSVRGRRPAGRGMCPAPISKSMRRICLQPPSGSRRCQSRQVHVSAATSTS